MRSRTEQRLSKQAAAYLVSCGASGIGDGIRTAALPLAVTAVSGRADLLGAVAVASRIPWLLFAIPAGVLADNVNRARAMQIVDALRFLTAGGLAAALLLHHTPVWIFVAFAFALGTAETVFDSCAEGLLQAVSTPSTRGRVNGARTSIVMITSDFAGPSLGGLLFQLWRFVPFAADAVSFGLSALLLGRIPLEKPAGARENPFRQAVAGIRWTFTDRRIRSFQVAAIGVNAAQSAAQTMLVLLVVKVHGAPTSLYGVLLTVAGIGAAAVGVVAGRTIDRFGWHRLLWPCVLSGVPILLGLAVAPDLWTVAAFLLLNSAFGVVGMVSMAAAQQNMVPPELIGRVSGAGRFLTLGLAVPAGAALAAWIASTLSVQAVYAFAAACTALVSLLTWPGLRPGALSEPPAD